MQVRERWGHTEAYREPARRAARYGDREWSEIKAEADQPNAIPIAPKRHAVLRMWRMSMNHMYQAPNRQARF